MDAKRLAIGNSVVLWILIAIIAKIAPIKMFFRDDARNAMTTRAMLHANPFLIPFVPYEKKEKLPIINSIDTNTLLGVNFLHATKVKPKYPKAMRVK